MSIQYPANWTASTNGLIDYRDLVAFYSPLQNLSDPFPMTLKISAISYNQNISLQDFTNYTLEILNQSQQGFDKLNSSEISLAGYPAYKIVFSEKPFENSTLKFYSMNIWTVVGNKGYLITYTGEEYGFNQSLPEFARILDTLYIKESLKLKFLPICENCIILFPF